MCVRENNSDPEDSKTATKTVTAGLVFFSTRVSEKCNMSDGGSGARCYRPEKHIDLDCGISPERPSPVVSRGTLFTTPVTRTVGSDARRRTAVAHVLLYTYFLASD